MTKKNSPCRISVSLVIGSLVLWLFSCSDQPDQPLDNAKTPINAGGIESVERSTPSVAKNAEATTDLIMAIKETKMVLKESELLLRQTPRRIGSNAPLMALEKELQAAENLLIDVQRSIEGGDYPRAKAQIHEITERTNQVNQQIREVIGKPHGS